MRQNGGEELLLARFIKASQPDILDFAFAVNKQHGRCSADANGVGDGFDNAVGLHASIREEFLGFTLRFREYRNEVQFAGDFFRQLLVEGKAVLAEVAGGGNNQE